MVARTANHEEADAPGASFIAWGKGASTREVALSIGGANQLHTFGVHVSFGRHRWGEEGGRLLDMVPAGGCRQPGRGRTNIEMGGKELKPAGGDGKE